MCLMLLCPIGKKNYDERERSGLVLLKGKMKEREREGRREENTAVGGYCKKRRNRREGEELGLIGLILFFFCFRPWSLMDGWVD